MLAQQTAATKKVKITKSLLFALPVVFFTIGYPFFRSVGFLPLLIACAAAAMSSVFLRRLVLLRTFAPFVLFSFVVLLVSLAEQMPKSWTIYYDSSAAIRQWIWVIILPFIATAFFTVFTTLRVYIIKYSFTLVIITYALSKFSRGFSLTELNYDTTLLLYTLTNDTTVVYLLFILWLFKKNRQPVVDLIALILMLMLSASFQSQLFMMMLIIIRFSPFHRVATILLFVLMSVAIVIAPAYYVELHLFDPNTGIRALFWYDTIVAVKETFGIGVGFGTEYISNDFSTIKDGGWTVISESGAGRLFVGTHSALYDVFLRTGVLGLLMFYSWFARQVYPPRSIKGLDAKIFSSIATLLIITSLVNVSFTSMNFLFGTAMCLAVLVAYRKEAILRQSTRLADSGIGFNENTYSA